MEKETCVTCLPCKKRQELVLNKETHIFLEVNSRTLKEDTHKFMRIPCNRLSSLNTGHFVSLISGKETSSAPCSVNVQPKTILFANISDWIDGVKCSNNRCSFGTVNKVWSVTQLNAFLYQPFQF